MHIVNEFTQGTLSVSVISRQFDINHNQIFRWVREARDGKAFWVTKAKQITELVAPECKRTVITSLNASEICLGN